MQTNRTSQSNKKARPEGRANHRATGTARGDHRLKADLGRLFRICFANGRLYIVRSRGLIDDAVRTVSDRLRRVADVCPIDIASKTFHGNCTLRRLLNLDRHRFTAAALLVGDLPEIGNGGADLSSERSAFCLAQRFEVGSKGIHALTIANAFVLSKQLRSKQ
jgi:hypothetical protein